MPFMVILVPVMMKLALSETLMIFGLICYVGIVVTALDYFAAAVSKLQRSNRSWWAVCITLVGLLGLSFIYQILPVKGILYR